MKVSIVTALFILILLLGIYALLRDTIKKQPWSRGFYDWVEPIEAKLWLNSKTILLARLKVVTGLLLEYLTIVGNIDFSPMLPFLSEKHRGYAQTAINCTPMALTIIGLIDEKVRKTTTDPIELTKLTQKEIDTNPAISAAVDDHATVRDDTVAKIELAKQ